MTDKKYLDIDRNDAGFILKQSQKGGDIDTAGIYYKTPQEPEVYQFIWTDPAIYTDEARAKFLELPQNERYQFIFSLLEKFYIDNPEYANFMRIQIYNEPLLLLNFFKGITKEHFTACGVSLDNRDYKNRYDEIQRRIKQAEDALKETPIDYDNIKLTQIWPILRIRDPFTESELAAFYYYQNPRSEIKSTTVKRANKIEYPLDKPNHYIWNLLETDTTGQIKFDMLPKKPELKALITYSINFKDLDNGVTITKRLTPFDKRVYIAVSALYNAGNKIITLSQIYYAMGNTGRPGQRDLNKINDAITKMKRAEIYLDGSDEAATTDYVKFFYDGDLLPMERLTAVVNGQVTEGAINLFREPPLITFAKERKQVTTIDIKLLQSPISKTDANLLIDDYLLERIHKEKRAEKSSCTILLETLYKYANINTYKQKQRAPEKIEKYLKYYKENGAFKNYKLTKDKIIITF